MFTTRKIHKLKIRSLDLVWVAGLLEGEGTFTPHRQRHKSKKKVRRSSQPRVQFQTQDKDVADKLASLLGHHVLGPYAQKRTKRPTFSSDKYKACWVVSIAGFKAASIASAIYPFMGQRRKLQIELALREWGAYDEDQNSR